MSYADRLDRIEAAIAPTDDFHVVHRRYDETAEQALARYAKARGCAAAEIRGTVVYLTDYDMSVF
jgi:hypothetical protein